MNKEIDYLDRFRIAIREWAIERVYEKGDDIETRLGAATKLEEFVLRGIGENKSFQPDKAYLDSNTRRLKD